MAASSQKRVPIDKQKLRAVFMGTPAFAATILDRILQDPGLDIVAVYCQPDRPAGRGKTLKMPEVKELALQHDLPVKQPLNFKAEQDIKELADFHPDVLLVAAYGLILPQQVLDIPTRMSLNVHASLLPRYRGAAPIQRAIMNGDPVTGVTIMEMEAGLDTGPMLMQRAVGIDINDTSATLHDELAKEGGDLLCEVLERLFSGKTTAIVQKNERATYAQKLAKSESLVSFDTSAPVLHALIRGMTPWPGATLRLYRDNQQPLSVLAAPGLFPLPDDLLFWAKEKIAHASSPSPGMILGVYKNALCVLCAEGIYAFTSLRPAGKKAMDGAAFFHGYLASLSQPRFIFGKDA